MQTNIRRAIRTIQEVLDRQQALDRAGGNGHSEALRQAVRTAIREELDARIAPGRRSVRAIVEAQVASSGAGRHPASKSDVAGQLMFRLGRVCFDRLKQGEDILGEGTFGVVYAGRYRGQEVAIKKARGVIGDPAVLREFRWVFFRQPWRGGGVSLAGRPASIVSTAFGNRHAMIGEATPAVPCFPAQRYRRDIRGGRRQRVGSIYAVLSLRVLHWQSITHAPIGAVR